MYILRESQSHPVLEIISRLEPSHPQAKPVYLIGDTPRIIEPSLRGLGLVFH